MNPKGVLHHKTTVLVEYEKEDKSRVDELSDNIMINYSDCQHFEKCI